MGSNPLRIRLNKIDAFIEIYDGIRYLVAFDYKQYDEIYNKIRYIISEKSGITDSINYNFARIRINSYNVILLINFLMKIKITTTIRHFCMRINPIHYIFK